MPITYLLAGVVAASPSTATQSVNKSPCERVGTTLVASKTEAPSIRPLAQMPPRKLIFGVLHMQGDCVRPVVVRDLVGTPAAPDPSRR